MGIEIKITPLRFFRRGVHCQPIFLRHILLTFQLLDSLMPYTTIIYYPSETQLRP